MYGLSMYALQRSMYALCMYALSMYAPPERGDEGMYLLIQCLSIYCAFIRGLGRALLRGSLAQVTLRACRPFLRWIPFKPLPLARVHAGLSSN